MDAQAETDSIPTDKGGMAFPRKGLFNTKRVMTSDLIPSLAQSIRALQCRTNMVCQLANSSMLLTKDDGSIPRTLKADGCIEVQWYSIPQCQMALAKEQVDYSTVYSHCTDVAPQMVAREIELLKLLVEYDASYRSLLQFAGFFDEFLEDLRWTITGNLRQATSIIGWLQRIPCFISSCDEYPTGLIREQRTE